MAELLPWLAASAISYAALVAIMHFAPPKDKWPRVSDWYFYLVFSPGFAIFVLAVTSPAWLHVIRHPGETTYGVVVGVANLGVVVIPGLVTFLSYDSPRAGSYGVIAGAWVSGVGVALLLRSVGLDMHFGAALLLCIIPFLGTGGLVVLLRERALVVRMLAESRTRWLVFVLVVILCLMQSVLLLEIFSISGFSVDRMLPD